MWLPYYDSGGSKIGTVRRGSTWPGKGREFSLTGWMPEEVLEFPKDTLGNTLPIVVDETLGITHCHVHEWGHTSGSKLHCHFWDEQENELATTKEGLEFTVTGTSSWRWVRDENGNRVNVKGWIITVTGNVHY